MYGLARVRALLSLLGLSMATAVSAWSGSAVAEAQNPEPQRSGIALRVTGEVPKPVELSADALARLPRTTARVPDSAGREIVYEGVQLVEVLSAAGVKFGHDLRGPALANYLVVEAGDGYRAVFALPELDPENIDHVVLLADRRDGKPLDANEGPLRIVIPGEKRHARWVRQVIVFRIGKA